MRQRMISRRSLMKSMKLILLIALVTGLDGCALLFGPIRMGPTVYPAPPSPQFPVVIGARVDADHLIVSTGRACPSGTQIGIYFGGSKGNWATIKVTTKTEVNEINTDDPPDTVVVTAPLQPASAWYDSIMTVVNYFPDQQFGWTATTDLSGLVDASAQHADDEYYFGDKFGWMTSAQVVARDGVDLLTVCTPTS